MTDDGRSEAPLPDRIVHVHIPKTAGTALFEAFRRAHGERLRVYPEKFESRYGQVEYAGFNFYGGHIGFKTARDIGGEWITVLRDPVDRFLSTYFFLRQMHATGEERSEKTALAARYDLDQFVQIRGEPALEAELCNRMTWQLAYSHRWDLRQELIRTGAGDTDVLRMAIDNLDRFAVIGLQTRMTELAEAIERRFGVTLSMDRLNVTGFRLMQEDLPGATLERIRNWVCLDAELWSAAQRRLGERQHHPGASPAGGCSAAG